MPTWRNWKKIWGPGLFSSLRGRTWSSSLIRGVMWWGLKWCWKTCVQKKMVPNHELFESIPLQGQGFNSEANVCELEDHVGEKGWSSNWPTKLGLAKNTHLASFPNCLLESIWVKFAFPYGLSPRHEEAKWNTIGVIGGVSAKLPHCYDHSLGFTTKAKGMERCKLSVQHMNHICIFGVQHNVQEWAHTLLSGLPPWDLESLWNFKCLKNNFKDKKSLDWILLYAIKNLLRRRCQKWVCTIHLNT